MEKRRAMRISIMIPLLIAAMGLSFTLPFWFGVMQFTVCAISLGTKIYMLAVDNRRTL